MADEAVMDRVAAIRRVSTLDSFYEEARRINLTPGWMPHEQPTSADNPRSAFRPAHWRYVECKAALDAAGRLIDVDIAGRRDLWLRNPIPGNDPPTTRTLVCSYQMIRPGERAPAHRHVPHAVRVILEARGSYSTVDGGKTPMETGDVILTPGWSWHEHGHDGDVPAYWLDGLDAPLTRALETVLFEDLPERFVPDVRTVTTSPYRFTRDDIARRLDRAPAHPDSFHGPRITLEAPTIPTMALTVERLAAGARTRWHRSSANRVFCAIEGSGESVIGTERFVWERGDTLVAPCRHGFEHRATTDAVLFTLSDEPLMRFARFYRVEEG